MKESNPAVCELYDQEEVNRRTWERGSGLVEYALLTALIAMIALGSIQYFAGATTEMMSDSASAVEEANTSP